MSGAGCLDLQAASLASRESPDRVILWAEPQRDAWQPASWGTELVHSTTSVTTAGVRERLPPEGAASPRQDPPVWGAGPQSPP